MNEALLEQIRRKVQESKEKIGEKVNEVLREIKARDQANIEQIDATRKFIKQLPDIHMDLERLKTSVEDKIEVLNENFYEQSQEEIADIWIAFARPIEIRTEQDDCIEHLDNMSNKYHDDLGKMQNELA